MLTLTSDDVHVWSVNLDEPAAAVEGCAVVLSDDERDRAERLRAAHDRRRFIVARARLREVLAGYLDCDARDLRFRAGSHGKPQLDAPLPPLVFNASHSCAKAVYAIAARGRVGIDVERVTRIVDHQAIADRFFSPAEAASLRALAVQDRPMAFFSCWTRKEAYVKAIGAGLSYPLDAFTVSVGRHRPAALIDHAHDPEEPRRWWLVDLPVAADYVAAVAFDGRTRRLRDCGDWSVHGRGH
jgi:4'-phosphopantetheinyl transferase